MPAQGLALARKLSHPISEAFAHWCAGTVHLMHREPEPALKHAEAVAEIAHEKGFPQYIAWATLLRGAALFEQEGGAEAIAEIRKGIDASLAIGSNLTVPYWLTLLADAYGQNGQAEEALVAITEAFDLVTQTEERFSEAELHRVKGQLLLEGDAKNEVEAESCFHRAIEIARSQNAKSWELRAATRLARLWCSQRKLDAARDLLTPVYDWFTEGFETADLIEARKLLDELA